MKIYWFDCETTGLDPSADALLELVLAEADLADPFDVDVGPICNPAFRFRASEHPPLSPFILDMHGKSGLLAECDRSTTTVAEVEELLLSVVPEVADRDERPTLAGSSVHFDHGFLRAKMPRLAARFSHRHYDVSAVKLFCQSLGMPRLPKAEAHRARDDVFESIDHARACAEWLMREGLKRGGA